MKRILLLLLLTFVVTVANSDNYTFDPYSLQYTACNSKRDCKRVGDELHCKKAYLVFGKIIPGKMTDEILQRTKPVSKASTPSDNNITVVFTPKLCKDLKDRLGEWECKDVTIKHVPPGR